MGECFGDRSQDRQQTNLRERLLLAHQFRFLIQIFVTMCCCNTSPERLGILPRMHWVR